jgi:hypothetical protein
MSPKIFLFTVYRKQERIARWGKIGYTGKKE